MISIATLNGGNMSIVTESPAPTGHAETWIKFSENDSWHEYDIEGAIDCPALVAAGLMPPGSGEWTQPDWTTQPYAVEIGTDVTSIGSYAFSGCSGLTNVTIPSSVTSIGDEAFSFCSGLTSVTIPDSVTSIGAYAFYDCSDLTSVTIGNSVTNIGSAAFYDCSGLTSVTIPDSVTSIGYEAFSGCGKLTSLTLLGKTLAQVQDMEDYSWGIDTSIINVA